MGEQGDQARVIPGHIAALDGLRAFAIIAVIFHHCGEYYLIQNSSPTSLLRGFVENLGSGVDLFFVLSGFLITGILLDSLGRTYFFKRFYWRRGLRIWPLYYAFLLAVFLVHRHVFSGIGIAPFALYYRNFLGPDRTSDVYIGQFWSLCVEEQFYLIWPLVIYFTPKRLRMPLICFLIGLAILLRFYLLGRGTDIYVIYRLPFCHMGVLLAGAAIAVLTRYGMSQRTFRKICWAAIFFGFVSLLWVGKDTWPTFHLAFLLYGLTGIALLFGGIVGLCTRGVGNIAGDVLGSTFLEAIGKRSYAMYVFHLVPLYVSYKLCLRMHVLPLPVFSALFVILTVGLVTYGLAWISWRYFEEPILRLKKWEWWAEKRAPGSAQSFSTE